MQPTPERIASMPSPLASSIAAGLSDNGNTHLLTPISSTDRQNGSLSGPSKTGKDVQPSDAIGSVQSSPLLPNGDLFSHSPNFSSLSTACTCTPNALAVFEAIAVRKSQLTDITIDQILAFHKHAISQCEPLLACQGCACSTGFNMLLIVIMQDLVQVLELLPAMLRDRSGRHSASQTPYQGREQVDPMEISQRTQSSGIPHTACGEYIVDSSDEWFPMMHALALVQLTRSFGFLQKLKMTATMWNRSAHHGLLTKIEKRFQTLRVTLEGFQ